MGLCIQEIFINETEGCRFGESDIYETSYQNIGKLYRSLIKEHGKCTGKMYREPHDKQIGWVFLKKDKYENSKEFYLKSTWVMVYAKKPTISTKTYPYPFK
tara:strand:+ start:766 stop:1068 length:303 start_codon:yes stop_codon:yes gene_type:complete